MARLRRDRGDGNVPFDRPTGRSRDASRSRDRRRLILCDRGPMLGSPMRIGVPKEIKTQEFRVGMTPSGVAILVSRGHTVLLEQGAGLGSAIPDEAYVKAGAKIVASREEVWGC